jgi:hypothetical protein
MSTAKCSSHGRGRPLRPTSVLSRAACGEVSPCGRIPRQFAVAHISSLATRIRLDSVGEAMLSVTASCQC